MASFDRVYSPALSRFSICLPTVNLGRKGGGRHIPCPFEAPSRRFWWPPWVLVIWRIETNLCNECIVVPHLSRLLWNFYRIWSEGNAEKHLCMNNLCSKNNYKAFQNEESQRQPKCRGRRGLWGVPGTAIGSGGHAYTLELGAASCVLVSRLRVLGRLPWHDIKMKAPLLVTH